LVGGWNVHLRVSITAFTGGQKTRNHGNESCDAHGDSIIGERLKCGTAEMGRLERSELAMLSAVATTDLFCLSGSGEMPHQHLYWATIKSAAPGECK
jgi:hypothetical protein